jgi:TDG/mug DNA glycosylase family protein
LKDVLAPGLRVVFCGINPGLYSAAVGHSFARPGNRFWPTLHAAGFTDRRLSPWEEEKLLSYGLGLTNIVNRATASADELSKAELIEGGVRLAAKMKRYRPAFLAMLGMGAYRVAFGRPKAPLGRQAEPLGGTVVWVLPSPSGLNAFYRTADLARLYGELRAAAGK